MKNLKKYYIALLVGGLYLGSYAYGDSFYTQVQLNNTTNPTVNGVSGGATIEDSNSYKEVLINELSETQSAIVNANALELSQQHNQSDDNNYSGDLGSQYFCSGLDKNIKNMPVLDQGTTGTCATFAATAILDMLKNGSDYYNVYSSLELGVYLSSLKKWEKDLQYEVNISGLGPKFPNPWNGSAENVVIDQDLSYGILIGQAEHDQDGYFSKNSEKSKIYTNNDKLVIPKLKMDVLYEPSLSNGSTSKISLKIKNAINKGELVELGITLDTTQGNTGCIAKIYPDANTGKLFVAPYSGNASDAWILSSKINTDIAKNVKGIGGHDLAVIGYVLTKNTTDYGGGFFILRNSWGKSAGNSGDFYVSFNYVDQYCIGAVAVSKS